MTSAIRSLREQGWDIVQAFEECAHCAKRTSHYTLIGTTPSKRRAAVPAELRKKYLAECGNRDAYTGLPSAKLELDHRMPHARRSLDEPTVTEVDISSRFQPLTAASNQLKRWACERCLNDGDRPAFMQIDVWVEGSSLRPASCAACPWAFPEQWREALHAVACRPGAPGT